jgi:glycosyltransferase involved in cell wall biosynthesis
LIIFACLFSERLSDLPILPEPVMISPMPTISIVLPARDEARALSELLPEIRRTMDGLGVSYETIVIDDGSTDGTRRFLEERSKDWPELVGLELRRNVGQTAALQAGIDRARGETIVTLDADGQNDPKDIPHLLEKLNEGFDLVTGWRVDRQDSNLSKKLPSRVANRLIQLMTGTGLHDQGCALKAFRAEWLKEFRIYGEQHRYLAALAEGWGAKVAEVPVNHRPRATGQSHYGWNRVPRVLLDLIFLKYILSYSQRPLHFFGGGGLVATFVGIVSIGYVMLQKLFGVPAAGRPLLLLGILLVVVGGILVTLGILAELLMRTHHEATGEPSYRIRRVISQTEDDSI